MRNFLYWSEIYVKCYPDFFLPNNYPSQETGGKFGIIFGGLQYVVKLTLYLLLFKIVVYWFIVCKAKMKQKESRKQFTNVKVNMAAIKAVAGSHFFLKPMPEQCVMPNPKKNVSEMVYGSKKSWNIVRVFFTFHN